MLALVAAIAKNNCIGKGNELVWKHPKDMEHFKNITNGKIVLMGRKTWESLPSKFRPLPNRKNIVITRQAPYAVPTGVEVYSTIDAALAAHQHEDIMVIGGAETYRQTIDRADTLYITQVDKEIEGDAFFPNIDLEIWEGVEREEQDGFRFITYHKLKS